MALKAVEVVGAVVGETLRAYEEQQANITKLSAAVNSSANLTAGSLQRILGYVDKLRSTSIFGDDELASQAAILASMGMTEAMIEKTLTAATGLASVGIGTLDTNVRQLAGTLTGSAGKLEKLVPSISGLSKAQMEAGAAIEVVADKYGKFSRIIAEGTLTGQTQLVKNLWDEIEAKVGSVFAIGKGAFLQAAIPALRTFPRLNAEIQGDEMVLKHHYDIGMAVGAAEGLVVPVLRNADRMSFGALEQAIKSFARKTEDGTLTLDDLRGGTFTISNGGVFGSLLSAPILNPPQVGILGLHRIEERPVSFAGEIRIRPMMYLALSYDHRIVDGLEAVRFLKRIKELVEHPEDLFLES